MSDALVEASAALPIDDPIDIFTSEKNGDDDNGEGTYRVPFRSVLHALHAAGGRSCNIFVDGEEEGVRFQPVSKSQLKKIQKIYQQDIRKAQQAQQVREKKEEEDRIKREAALEEAKQITISADPSLPAATKCKIRDLKALHGQRVQVSGWVHQLRRQGRSLMFMILRDGSGLLQAVLNGDLCRTVDGVLLTTEYTVTLYGTVNSVPEGKQAPGGHELCVDFWEVVGAAPPGGLDNAINKNSHVDVRFDNRHLVLRNDVGSAGQGEQRVVDAASKILRARMYITQAFRSHYMAAAYIECFPPTLVTSQAEGGSTLFSFNYFGTEAYLTQTSQLYLETMIPVFGDVYCIAQSYRAESHKTRRHLSEFSHVEAECAFISFDELMNRIEYLVCDVIERVAATPAWSIVQELHPGFAVPKRPFKRMTYVDAIEYCRAHKILNTEGKIHEFGDDISELAERTMTDQIGEPILLNRFPAEIKAFYMQRCADDRRVTESVDLLMPGVGEIVGGSMRVWDEAELMEGFKREGINPAPYYWYIDQRRFGTCPHGGYGLGLERFLAWVLNQFHVRDVCLYPRYKGRCAP